MLMTSNDIINLSELKLLLENHFSRSDKQLADFQRDNADFRTLIIKEFADFKDDVRLELQDVRSEIAGVRAEIASVRSELKAEIADVRSEVRIQSTRIDNLVHWNYWFIALFVAFFLMPTVIEGVRSVFKSITDSVTALFRRK